MEKCIGRKVSVESNQREWADITRHIYLLLNIALLQFQPCHKENQESVQLVFRKL